MQDRGVQVLHLERIFDRTRTEFVGRTVTDAPLDSTASHPHGKSVGVVIATGTLGVLGGRLTSEFAAPDDKRFV